MIPRTIQFGHHTTGSSPAGSPSMINYAAVLCSGFKMLLHNVFMWQWLDSHNALHSLLLLKLWKYGEKDHRLRKYLNYNWITKMSHRKCHKNVTFSDDFRMILKNYYFRIIDSKFKNIWIQWNNDYFTTGIK